MSLVREENNSMAYPDVSSGSVDVSAVFDYMLFLRRFQDVSREVHIHSRFENDVEHSFQLAMMSWWLSSQLKLDFNQELLLTCA